ALMVTRLLLSLRRLARRLRTSSLQLCAIRRNTKTSCVLDLGSGLIMIGVNGDGMPMMRQRTTSHRRILGTAWARGLRPEMATFGSTPKLRDGGQTREIL